MDQKKSKEIVSATLDALQSRYDRLGGVFRLTRAVAQATSENEVCSAAIEMLIEALPGRRASILLFDPDGVIRFKAWHGLSEEYRNAVTGHTPWRPEDIDAVPIVVPDVLLDRSSEELHATFAAERIRAVSFIPLLGGQRVLGKFMIYGDVPGDPVGDELPLARNIADLVAIAVRRCRSDAELQRERTLFNSGPVVMCRWSLVPGRPPLYVSPNIRQFGYSPEDFTSHQLDFYELIHPDDRERVRSEVAAHLRKRTIAFEQDYRLRKASGDWAWLYDRTVVAYSEDGATVEMDGYVIDITERKHLDQELLQAQKIESIGRLAGGVAHDFNNLLTVIIGAAEAATLRQIPNSETARALESIRKAAERAATLTSQLLAFARKQRIERRVVDLQTIVDDTEPMLRRLIGEHIELVIAHNGSEPMIEADPVQLQQILVNLALNARDAMPDGGRLEIVTARVRAQMPDSVTLTVRDSGVGIDPDTLAHLFEPFFTTKEVGRGTGLGLATCYGIVKQTGGSIEVESSRGRGTAFHISFPHANAKAAVEKPEPHVDSLQAGLRPATVLLAEDEPMVREFAVSVLHSAGLQVLPAADGREALALASRHPGTIDVVLTDVVMPRLGGKSLVSQLREQRPEVKVLFMSGYAPEDPAHGETSGSPLISKPFTAVQLISAVRALLDSSSR
ncbi:MAG: ATP-binding protein [Acidobacteriota bacterium]